TRADSAAIFDSSRATLRPLAPQYTAACGPRSRCLRDTGEAAARRALFRGDESELLQTSLDCAQRASVLARDRHRRIAGLEGGDQSALLLRRPCLADVVGKLCAPQRPCRRLLEGREAGEECSQHIGVLEHRLTRKLLAGDGVDSLDERLQDLPCPGLRHDGSPLA